MHHFCAQNNTISFLKKVLIQFSGTSWTLPLWRNFKKSHSGSRIMRICHFLQKMFLRRLLINIFPFIHFYLHSKIKARCQPINEILRTKRKKRKSYWSRAILATTWGIDFSQTSIFHIMSQKHKHFRITHFSDKTDFAKMLKNSV